MGYGALAMACPNAARMLVDMEQGLGAPKEVANLCRRGGGVELGLVGF